MRFSGLSVFLCLIVVVTLGSQSIQSFPTGIGSLADNGCTCHGGYSNATQPNITGMPASFESNVSYNITLNVESETEPTTGSAQGGFRFQVSDGAVNVHNASRVQFMDEGWTHTEAGNQYRSWNLSWTAPSDNSTTVDFVLHVNAVNGNGNSDGDMWNSIGYTLPGTQYDGEVVQLDLSDELDNRQYTILYGGLLALLFFLYYAIK